MPEHQYLSIGEVLGLLLEDFPDVTISKIRFLESQGLIEPERTPSGYRKFYDHDVDLLRAILHEQKANFLPLKVIRDRIESGTIDKETTATRTPPRGIRNVDATGGETRDSVFRRTDGGPEWADGQALIPGDPTPGVPHPHPSQPITASVPVVQSLPFVDTLPFGETPSPAAAEPEPAPAEPPIPAEPVKGADVVAALIEAPPATARDVAAPVEPPSPPTATPTAPKPTARSTPPPTPHPTPTPTPTPTAAVAPDAPPVPTSDAPAPASAMAPRRPRRAADATSGSRGLPFNREELCSAAGITTAQLAQLEDFGVVVARGTGSDATYQPDSVDVARIAGQFLEQGIDARHLRAWRQAADREATLFEQRIMPLLRQRNPQSRQLALDTLSDLAGLGGELRATLVSSLLRHHFEGG